ncbi:MAG: HAD-IIIC family phosphatase [Nitrosomonadales bacterium]|nr:HAD-IIIC family phosphatase [Nitrosomonadales bacterium]
MRMIAINVWRNHAFEPVVALARAYQAYGRYSVDYRIGEYDDTLMFGSHQPADMELLWIDSSRYLENISFEDWLAWLSLRVRSLRNISNSPVIVATWLGHASQSEQLRAMLEQVPAVFFADMQEVCNEAGVNLLDLRTAAMAGTPISNPAQPLLARKLACHWVPAATFPPIKVVALDLDNTLHAGILGEDGIPGVQLTPAHQTLQLFIKSLQQRGIFIALVSRNEREDVEALFSERDDYPLRWNDFSAVEVSWGDKATALANIAKALRIAPDAILFVDDNPGELASVVAQLPGIHTVYATPDAMQTQRVVEHYPGLWRWKVEADDARRVKDMKANAERDELLKEAMDPTDYFRSLQTELVFRYDPIDQLGRLADLCNKTNQFNLAMRRFNQAELADRMARHDACVVSVRMSDRLSDSGVIAVIVAERQDGRLMIEELCISCRAMGRQLEDTLILEALRGMPVLSGCTDIVFCARVGPRNQPAFAWLSRMLDNDKIIEDGFYPVPVVRLSNFASPEGISLI